MNLISEVKKKREFSQLPDSIVKRALEISGEDIKETRALLRKYFGVFLTNKVLKGKLSGEEILKSHKSSMKRDYLEFYRRIFENIKDVKCVVDLGCGVNGFSYSYLKDILGDVDYFGIEASGQLVGQMNNYFKGNNFEKARAICRDLFDIEKIKKILKKQEKNNVVFLFQVVDALENLEKDFSKKFILEISKECEFIVLSLSTESLSGRKKFEVKRKWIIDFLEDNFEIKDEFVMCGERVLVVRNPNS